MTNAEPLGSITNPYREAWPEGHIVLYGACCVCTQCEKFGRISCSSDFYPQPDGGLLCETCLMRTDRP